MPNSCFYDNGGAIEKVQEKYLGIIFSRSVFFVKLGKNPQNIFGNKARKPYTVSRKIKTIQLTNYDST